MTKKLLVLSTVIILTGCSHFGENSMMEMDHGEETSRNTPLQNLIDSPRHHEWVSVDNEGKTIHTWVVYPEVSEKAPVVLVIHENRGLNDWARSIADQIAEAGYIAVAPDLLSGFSDQYNRTTDFPDEDAARTAISELDPNHVQSDLQAVIDWAKTIPSANGNIASAGFCWGGAQSFELATNTRDLVAALVFYGTGPTDAAAYENINVPIYGFYGGADERINATIEDSQRYMFDNNNVYDYQIYNGAGHAFMRLGQEPDATADNAVARDAAFFRMKEILSDFY